MTIIHHTLAADDATTMAATRAYLATLPPMAIVPDAREGYDAFMAMTPAAADVRFEPGTVAGVAGWWCLPATADADAALLYLHGGGYVMGSAQAYRNLASHLALRSGLATFVPDYALAPETPFPAAFDQAVAILSALQNSGRTRLAVAGDSAGGGLALAAVQAAAPLIRAVVLFSPWTDMTHVAPSFTERAARDPIVSRNSLEVAADQYAGAHDRLDARLSPRFGDFAGVPPIQIHVGSDEVLLDDAMAIGAAVGAQSEVHVWEGMTHVFPAALATLRAARAALDMSGAFIAERLFDNGLQS